MELDLNIILILVSTAFVAGFIDAIAGGGGMITIPALLIAEIPPHEALGTNKLQSCFGSFSATMHFYKKGHLEIKKNLPFVLSVFIFASLGTILVSIFDTKFLEKFIPFLLIIFAIYFLFSPKISEEDSAKRAGNITLLLVLGIIGFYDGFLGPGTGSFLMLALIMLGGFGIKKALANAKLYNFTSNIASLLVFAISGNVLFLVGILMGIGQFIGANLGARTAISHGIKIIKPLIVIVSIAVCANLIYRQYLA